MTYEIEFKPRALKDLAALPKSARRRVVTKIEALANHLAGDVKHLTNFTPEYRLRVGKYRVLFEIEERTIVIYRVVHRKDAYQQGAEARMLKLHPEIVSKNGKKKFVVLPYEEFLALQERLADAADLIDLRKAKRAEGKKRSIPLAAAKSKLGLR